MRNSDSEFGNNGALSALNLFFLYLFNLRICWRNEQGDGHKIDRVRLIRILYSGRCRVDLNDEHKLIGYQSKSSQSKCARISA